MKLHPSSLTAALLLALASCGPPISQYTESEAPKRLTLDDATMHVDVRFSPGSPVMAAGDAAPLRRMAAAGAIAPSDRVLVAAGGNPALAAARVGAVSAELVRYGVVASALPHADVAPDRASIEVVRYLVTLPPCPNWSKEPANDFTNAPESNYGCANVSNLGRMVANPADLVSGQPLGPAAGPPTVTAVQRYLEGRVTSPGGAVTGSTTATFGGGGGTSGGSTTGTP